MPDDKSKKGNADRKRVSTKERYEVDYEAKKTGKSAQQVKDAAKKVGPSRAKIEAELKKKKR